MECLTKAGRELAVFGLHHFKLSRPREAPETSTVFARAAMTKESRILRGRDACSDISAGRWRWL
jgi:hypothetical protein